MQLEVAEAGDEFPGMGDFPWPRRLGKGTVLPAVLTTHTPTPSASAGAATTATRTFD